LAARKGKITSALNRKLRHSQFAKILKINLPVFN